ncbi:threonine dehydrogenase-like Zn-dependent dehydrogenase [Melghirimyces profundicolus]|uniref:Threonine dehydrogenase-like Zn-dependent dehydrogenase n=1 Tax=Melghirimyces profundicolus TaxID=1242148 RepID=A0A2T6C9J7_9BACL|nr:alcohol dehydrogenase catalytic domain-containing protein [Melghirimyces profundicolus]PTX64981.1 threonine dehydrogenase-like Zn-dependent dehydrogenase [Melghirimyces profundicolus]
MKGVVFDFALPRSALPYLATKALGNYVPSLGYGPGSVLRLREVSEPSLPGPRWIKVKPVLSGVCGTDMGAIFFKTSPALTPFNTFPSVLGHETVGVVTEVGEGVRSLKKGQRVTIDPFFSCEARGVASHCPACREGLHCLCRHSADTTVIPPGMLLGFCRGLPGAWSERITVHETMAIPLSDEISDELGVMMEPLAVGLHAVLRRPPSAGDHVLVIGGGMIAYTVIAALRLLGNDCRITHYSLLPHQREMALRMGADQAFIDRGELEAHVLSLPVTSKYKPIIGPHVYTGGFDGVFDCIGSPKSLDDALRFTRERGFVTVVGLSGEIRKLDLSFIWMKELSIIGTVGYGREDWKGRSLSTYQLLLELLSQGTNLPLEELITHEFSLDRYREAIAANVHRGRYESIKTVFRI